MNFRLRIVTALLLTAWVLRAYPQQRAVQRDESAITALTQALTSGGGTSLLRGIQGILATGTITYAQDNVQADVKVRCQGRQRFRLDASLPDGVRTAIASRGREVVRDSNGIIRWSSRPDAASSESFPFPYVEVLHALDEPQMNIVDLGVMAHGGLSLREIRVQRVYPANDDSGGYKSMRTARDFLLDPTTYQIRSILDGPTARSIAQGNLSFNHEVQFSDYKQLDGIQVPFTSAELVHSQLLSTITFSNIEFNPTFADSDFSLN